MTTPADRYRACLEALTPHTLDDLRALLSEDVRFKDPFNNVTGADATIAVFRHMYETLGEVRFTVEDMMCDGPRCLMHWRFTSRLRGRPWSFAGTSVVTFAPDGRVAEHVDHWDAAREFYERLPVIGWLLAWLRGRLATG